MLMLKKYERVMKSKFFVTLHPKMKIIVTQHAMKEINYVCPTLFAYLV